MSDWGRQLLRRGALEAALAFALGFAFVSLVEALVTIPADALAQHVVQLADPGRIGLEISYNYLSFRVGSTVIYYGGLLVAGLTLAGVIAAVYLVHRARARTLGRCPYCLTFVLPEAEVCPGCAYEFLPAEADDSAGVVR